MWRRGVLFAVFLVICGCSLELSQVQKLSSLPPARTVSVPATVHVHVVGNTATATAYPPPNVSAAAPAPRSTQSPILSAASALLGASPVLSAASALLGPQEATSEEQTKKQADEVCPDWVTKWGAVCEVFHQPEGHTPFWEVSRENEAYDARSPTAWTRWLDKQVINPEIAFANIDNKS